MAKTIKIIEGETLSTIATREGVSIDEIISANPDSPSVKSKDLIIAGGDINIPDVISADTVIEDVPGLGTLERTTKPTFEPTPDVTEDVTPATDDTAPATDEEGEVVDIPSFGPPEPTDQRGTLSKQFEDINTQIDKISKDILASKAPTPEETQLLKELQAKKEQLRTFDLSTLKTAEDIAGQRISTTFIAGQQAQERRTRALERLGFAQEAQSLVEQIGLTQSERQALGAGATAELALAGKKLDLALGLQTELDKLDAQEKDEARAFILDVIDFADGKTFEELDLNTQVRLTEAIANSPLTADMVKTALENSAKGADRILTVAEARSLGVEFGTKVSEAFGITPEGEDVNNPGGYSDQELRRLRQGGVNPLNVAESDEFLSKTRGQTANLQDSGLDASPLPIQTYYLNTPSAFQDQYNREVASGERQPSETLDDISTAYQEWFDANKSKSTRDWGAILNP